MKSKNEESPRAVQDFWFADNDLHVLDQDGSRIVFKGITILDVKSSVTEGMTTTPEKVTATFQMPPAKLD